MMKKSDLSSSIQIGKAMKRVILRSREGKTYRYQVEDELYEILLSSNVDLDDKGNPRMHFPFEDKMISRELKHITYYLLTGTWAKFIWFKDKSKFNIQYENLMLIDDNKNEIEKPDKEDFNYYEIKNRVKEAVEKLQADIERFEKILNKTKRVRKI